MANPSQIDPVERCIVLRLKAEREAKGISAASLARLIGIGRNTIPNLERDEARPTLWVLLTICDGLNLDFAEVAAKAQKEVADRQSGEEPGKLEDRHS